MDVLRRLQRVSLMVALTVAAVVAAITGSAAPVSADDAVSGASDPAPAGDISIVHTPAVTGPASGGTCLPSLLAMRYTTSSDTTTFRLRVVVTAPLCQPISAVAVIYAMPGGGVAWPQTLLERAPVELSRPGVTEIAFTRPCRPVQFDVVTGATPQQIAPWGVHHGPLLFPFDTNTTRQHGGCGPAPVVPEAPVALLLPASAAVVVGGAAAVVLTRRRRSGIA